MRVIAATALPIALVLVANAAETATVTIGAAKDNSIFQDNTSNTSGGSAGIFSGTNGMGSPRRGLIAFDIAANVPAGSTITEVQLTLHLGNAPLSDNQDIGLHKLAKDWGEGTAGSSNPAIIGSGMGASANPGDATWNEAMFGSVNWTSHGADGDYLAIPSAVASVGGPIDTPHTWGSTAAFVSDVQSWLDTPASNFGWAVINANEGTIRSLKAFYTREATQNSSGLPNSLDPSWRPALTVSFVDSVEPSGDYNSNGIVDAADYVLWRNTLGNPVLPAGNRADGDKSGAVDDGDYAHWRSRFGKVINRAAAGRSVPEPGTLSLVFLIGPLCIFILPRRTRHMCSSPPRPVPIVLTSLLLTACVFSAEAGRSEQPIQRFGVSDFRLTTKGGNGPTFRFSPDGTLIAGANWAEVKLWSFPDGKLLHDFSDAIQTNCIGFTADGKELLALEQRRMEIHRFDVASGRLLGTARLEEVEEERGAKTYRLSPDGKWLTMTEVYSHLAIWGTTTGKRQFRKATGLSKAARGGISDANVLTLWDSLFIDRYDVRTGEQLSRKKIYQRMGVLASNPQGTLLAAYSPDDKAIIFWDTVEDKQVGGKIPVADEHKRELRDMALSADGRRFGFWRFRDKWLWNRQVAIFDVETGKMISSFDPPGAYLLDQPEISPDGRYMYLAGGRSVFTPVDTSTGKLVREIPDHILAVEKLAFTPDGRTLLVGSHDKRQAWNVDNGEPGPVFEKWNHTPHIAAVSNNSALVSGIKGGGIRLQSIETGAVEREYETANNKYFSEIQLSVDRKTFVGLESPRGGQIRRWNVADGEVVLERQIPVVDFHRGFELSKMSRGLILGGSRLIRLEQVVPASKRPDGSIDPGGVDLVLEDWATKIVTNRLPLPALGRFAFADYGGGTMFAVVVSDAQSPRPYGEKWGSTHLLVWDVATGWEQLRIDREMHNYFDAFALVAITRDGRLAATVSEGDRVKFGMVSMVTY